MNPATHPTAPIAPPPDIRDALALYAYADRLERNRRHADDDLDERRTIDRRRDQLDATAEPQHRTADAPDRLRAPDSRTPDQTGWLT